MISFISFAIFLISFASSDAYTPRRDSNQQAKTDFHQLFAVKPLSDPSQPGADSICNVQLESYGIYTWTCELKSLCPTSSLYLDHSHREIKCDASSPFKICCPHQILVDHEQQETSLNAYLSQIPTQSTFYTLTKSTNFDSLPDVGNVAGSGFSSFQSTTDVEIRSDFGLKKETPVIHNVASSGAGQGKLKKFIDCSGIDTHLNNLFTWTCQRSPCKDLEVQNRFVKDVVYCDKQDESKICCAEPRRGLLSSTKRPSTRTTTVNGLFPVYHHDDVRSTDKVLAKSDNVKFTIIKPSILDSNLPDSLSEEIQELKKKKYNKFDLDLLYVTSQANPNKNIVISPASIKSLLALLVEGAGGTASSEILQALQFTSPQNSNKQKNINLLRRLQSLIRNKSSSIALESQNKIYKAPDVQIKEEYEHTLKSNYAAEIEQLDFSDADHATNKINEWVKTATHGLIPSLVSKDNIKNTMKLFLVNYIYLKANWDIEFHPSHTRQGCFHDLKNECQTVNFMSKERVVNYTESAEYKAEIFEIPFKDPRYTMVFMLPSKETDVYELSKSLNRSDLLKLFSKLEPTSVNLTIPRTTIEYSSDMLQILQQLNIKSIFGPGANLTSMLKKNARLSVSDIIHKARVEINEEGAKAAGASGGSVQVLSLDMDLKLLLDRPFIFFIRDTTVAGVLFEGIVVSPDKADSVPQKKF